MIRSLILALAALAAFTAWAPQAEAGTRVAVGIGVGGGYYGGCGPYYGRPYYGGWRGYGYRPYPYYRPYAPVYYAPAPVYYAPAPAYVEGPVYVEPYSATRWQVTQVQTQLGRLGYYQGAPDGVVGPMTRNAVANFQQDRGLAVTGTINPQVLNALSISL